MANRGSISGRSVQSLPGCPGTPGATALPDDPAGSSDTARLYNMTQTDDPTRSNHPTPSKRSPQR
jgi:hypothetical protein